MVEEKGGSLTSTIVMMKPFHFSRDSRLSTCKQGLGGGWWPGAMSPSQFQPQGSIYLESDLLTFQ